MKVKLIKISIETDKRVHEIDCDNVHIYYEYDSPSLPHEVIGLKIIMPQVCDSVKKMLRNEDIDF
jgi:hypothetical protein